MSLFSSLKSKIFGVYRESELKRSTADVVAEKRRQEAAAPAPAVPQTTEATPESATSSATIVPGVEVIQAGLKPDLAPVPAPAADQITTDNPETPAQTVDVAAALNQLAKKSSEDLDWKRSIVDLMKLVGLDSSLKARKELADELGYEGDKSESAAMNVWLHKAVLTKLSQNGGKVPDELIA